MKISRRAFILSGLVFSLGFLYWKNDKLRLENSSLDSFLRRYESVIPLRDILSVDHDIRLFESKLVDMLNSLGYDKSRVLMDHTIRGEYRSGKIQLENGWIVSETEYKILILKKRYV